MSYSPLVVGETEEYLEITNDLVGTYVYKVMLKCLPAKTKELEERHHLALAFQCGLECRIEPISKRNSLPL